MCGPTVVVRGSDEQKKRYLRPLFTGEEMWCQLFSEPGAGSDVAGLSTAASATATSGSSTVRRSGRRSPTSRGGACSSFRTDPDVPQARGPHRTSSSTCRRPASRCGRCVQMTGEAEFNEVYFTDVRIPDAERLGDVGDGLARVADHAHERAGVDRRRRSPRRAPVRSAAAVKVWQDTPADRRDPACSDELMKLWIEAEVNRLTNIRAGAEPEDGHARARRLDRQARVGRAQQAHLRVQRSTSWAPNGDALRRVHDDRARARDGVRAPAEGVPARPGQLDRGRHVRGHAQHPRRARARPARRRAGRQGRPLELRCLATSSSRQAAQVAECRPRRPVA